jgi:hypothetical protein
LHRLLPDMESVTDKQKHTFKIEDVKWMDDIDVVTDPSIVYLMTSG